MKYRTKLYVSLLAIALISTLMALWIIYYETRNQLLKQIKAQVITVAATTAALIDEELIEELIKSDNENSKAFWELKSELMKVKKANQRNDIFIKYIYVMRPNPENPKQLIYVIDSELNPSNENHLNDIEPTSQILGLLTDQNLEHNFSPEHFITDIYGTWLTGYVPIRNKEGKYLATVGVDLNASDVFHAMFRLLQYEFFALAASIFVAVFGAFFLSRRATKSLNLLCQTVSQIGHGDFKQRISLETKDEFRILGEAVNSMAQGLEERERMKMNFARYVSSHVLDRILQSETPLKLEGERKKITLLFSDIKGFTTLAEKHPPEVVVGLLNEYFETMISIIFKNHGTLDKFLGDGLMVEFGAPLDDPLEELHAVTAALEMQKALNKLCNKWEKEGKPTIQIGIGIHTGIAVLGTIGSEQRMEYTAIGDSVNVASRIQAMTRKLNADILISETTYQAVKESFHFESLGPIILPGRKEPLSLYTIKIE